MNKKSSTLKTALKNLMQKDTLRNIVVILGISGIALIFISSLPGFSSCGSPTINENTYTVESYRNELENELRQIISEIEGAGNTKVLLTLENSAEIVYNEKSDNKTKTIEPKIRGVIVVCEGGNDPITVSRIVNALQSVLDISSSKISVTPLSKSN